MRNNTGVKGVHVHSQNGTFIAQIIVSNKTRHLGSRGAFAGASE